ncbi:MAG: EAL domain-containing protein [Alphaproteobacteria bacterium]
MPRLDQLVVPAVAAVAGIITAAILYRIGATDAVGALLVAGFVTFVATYCENLIAQFSENARTGAEINHLGSTQQTMRAEAELTRRALLELKQHVDDSISSRNDRVVTEVKVLETLVRRMAEGVAARAQSRDPAPGDIPLPARRHPTDVARSDRTVTPRGNTRDAVLEMVRRALEENRVDLYLQPVVSLPQRRVRYYEALSRLRTEDGRVILPSQYIKVAEPAGLMSVIDNMLLFRCVQAMKAWTQRNREIGIFYNLSRETLQDRVFFGQFMEWLEQSRELAGLLIFEISQETFETLNPVESANITRLGEMGFTLSIDRVTHLDIDFKLARARRVRFLKVPATLIVGDPEQTGVGIHPADLKQWLMRYGLNLIAERIEHEREVMGVLEYQVDYGQGFLFGEPKPIRDAIMDQGLPTLDAAERPVTGSPLARPRQVGGGTLPGGRAA